jgi:post-segregation antitoxin (ccd killing protein)
VAAAPALFQVIERNLPEFLAHARERRGVARIVEETFQAPRGRQRLAALALGCINRRMPRMQLYLPDDLYEMVKARGLPASELLQKAVRAEIRRLDLLDENTRYLAELEREVGEPTPAERARAKAAVDRITKRTRRKAG